MTQPLSALAPLPSRLKYHNPHSNSPVPSTHLHCSLSGRVTRNGPVALVAAVQAAPAAELGARRAAEVEPQQYEDNASVGIAWRV